MSHPLIIATGVCHRDAELACLWLRWTSFLAEQDGGSMKGVHCLVVLAMSVTREQEAALRASVGGKAPRTVFVRLTDEIENAYPKSASHLFLRTLEIAERLYVGSPVIWNEVDCWPLRPSWYAEIDAAYQVCGKPFFGAKVGTQHPHLAGNSVQPHNWRELAPSIAGVLDAPDIKLWGPGKGQPWDVFCRHETTPQMAESKLWYHVWKDRSARATKLADIPATACMFHQDKTGAIAREIAAAHYPEFMASLPSERRFFVMNGNTSRLRAVGVKVTFSYSRWAVGGWRSAVCSDELEPNEASALAALVGRFGVREVKEPEFLQVTGRREPVAKKKVNLVARPSAPVPHTSHPNVYVMLGRYGDIVNILPMLKAEADAGRRPTLVVAQDFADILDGVSYVDRIVWDGAYDRLPDALRWLRRDKGITAPIVPQYHRNPYDKSRLTDSYQKECWRLAGKLKDFEARGPLVFDRRDDKREEALVLAHTACSKPVILLGLDSVSSPLANKAEITAAICRRFSDTHEVLDLAHIKAARVYDLIGLLEAAALTISADTMFIHLARAGSARLLALVNSGWRGSVCEHAAGTIRYEHATPEAVVAEAVKILQSEKPTKKAKPLLKPATLFHAVDLFGDDARHLKARASWNAAYQSGAVVPAHFAGGSRNAKSELGDPRALPFLKDVLWAAIPADSTKHGDDIVVWGNSDISFSDGFSECVRAHVGKHHAAAMRRTETNGQGHPGRDVFAFTVDFLHEHWDEIPDYVLGAPVFDLGLVALIRKFHGLPPITVALLNDDTHPADMPSYATHESHAPEWQVSNMDSVPSVMHNRKLFREWAKKYEPLTKFTRGGNLK